MDEFSTFHHPLLGEMYNEDVDWVTDEADLAISETPTRVALCGGDETGPSQESLDGFEWIRTNWPVVRRLIQDEAYDRFYLSYVDARPNVPRFSKPSELWGTEVLIDLSIYSADDFTLTLRFDWQAPDDSHEVTFYVEGRECRTHSVDG